jgi:hypothetical protein
MSFKKFIDFISESSLVDPRKKDIEEVSAKPSDANLPEVCPKCGESAQVCDCFIDDYYDARTPQYSPKGKTIKRDNKKKLK